MYYFPKTAIGSNRTNSACAHFVSFVGGNPGGHRQSTFTIDTLHRLTFTADDCQSQNRLLLEIINAQAVNYIFYDVIRRLWIKKL